MRQFFRHAPQRGDAQAPGRRLAGQLRPVELPHDARHGPGLAIDLAQAGAAELTRPCVVAHRCQRGIVEEAVQEGGVAGVDAHLEGLQPVAMPQALVGEGVGARGLEAVEAREGRLRSRLAEPGEQNAAALHHRVLALAHALVQAAAQGFGRGVQASARGIELPAVEGAAQAIALEAAVGQIGAAVRAVAVQQSPAAGVVAEQHHVLPHHAHGLQRTLGHARVGGGVELVDQGHRLPVAAQQGTAVSAGAVACQAFVLLGVHRGLLRWMLIRQVQRYRTSLTVATWQPCKEKGPSVTALACSCELRPPLPWPRPRTPRSGRSSCSDRPWRRPC